MRRATLCVAAVGLLSWAGHAVAQDASIGGARLAENDVRGQTASGTSPIHVGDHVFQNEFVRTAAASTAQLVLRDETNVSLGPLSQVKLDQFIFAGSGSTARRVVLDAGKGAFRFFSGNSASAAYETTTPQATIGVRGTIYDVQIEPNLTRVVIQEGSVHVCVRGTNQCRDLTAPGTSVTVGPGNISPVFTPAQTPWHFADLCVDQPGLCNRTLFASLDLPPPDGVVPPAIPFAVIGSVFLGSVIGDARHHNQVSP
jgi:hypothetical protein